MLLYTNENLKLDINKFYIFITLFVLYCIFMDKLYILYILELFI